MPAHAATEPAPGDARQHRDSLIAERVLFMRLRRRRDPQLRDQLIERLLPLAHHVARRYDRPGRCSEDIHQVACLALVKAVDRFDPVRGVAFSTYAVPTIVGELKRYFRDQTWAVRPTRELQERALRVSAAASAARGRLGREPTVAELAGLLGCGDEDVVDALRAGAAYDATSLDAPRRAAGDSQLTLDELVGADDGRLLVTDLRLDVAALVDRLSPRERLILRLRFERELTEPEIAAALGASRNDVSRTLRRSLERLRDMPEGDGYAHGGDRAEAA